MATNLRNYAHSIVGNSPLGSNDREQNDYYTTGNGAISRLEDVYKLPKKVWECACGNGRLSEQLKDNGHTVYSSELFKRGYGKTGVDFLKTRAIPQGYDCICTNPPYNLAIEFCNHALSYLKKRSCGNVVEVDIFGERKPLQ